MTRQLVRQIARRVAARAVRSGPGRWARRTVRALTNFVVTHDSHANEPTMVVTAKLGLVTLGQTVVSPMWRSAGIDLLFSGGTWLHPLARGVGLGTLLLRLAVSESSRRWPGERIFANISDSNFASLKAYEKAGFVRVEMPALSEAIASDYRRRGHTAQAQVIVCFETRHVTIP